MHDTGRSQRAAKSRGENILLVTDIQGLDELSGPEKILLVEKLWSTIAADESEVPVPDSHLRELDRRLNCYNATPGKLLTLEELQHRVATRK
jgi:putative addiction module component (TIGR02574 family)